MRFSAPPFHCFSFSYNFLWTYWSFHYPSRYCDQGWFGFHLSFVLCILNPPIHYICMLYFNKLHSLTLFVSFALLMLFCSCLKPYQSAETRETILSPVFIYYWADTHVLCLQLHSCWWMLYLRLYHDCRSLYCFPFLSFE